MRMHAHRITVPITLEMLLRAMEKRATVNMTIRLYHRSDPDCFMDVSFDAYITRVERDDQEGGWLFGGETFPGRIKFEGGAYPSQKTACIYTNLLELVCSPTTTSAVTPITAGAKAK